MDEELATESNRATCGSCMSSFGDNFLEKCKSEIENRVDLRNKIMSESDWQRLDELEGVSKVTILGREVINYDMVKELDADLYAKYAKYESTDDCSIETLMFEIGDYSSFLNGNFLCPKCGENSHWEATRSA